MTTIINGSSPSITFSDSTTQSTALPNPSTAGNVLVSNGTVWQSTALGGAGSLQAVATGSLSNGDKVVVNADGTVSVVAGANQVIGSKTAYTSFGTEGNVSSTYDPTTNRVVIITQRTSDGNGYAVVGTVSGTTISFGTPVNFSGAVASYPSITRVSGGKVVIAYRDEGNAGKGTAVVGTISGTTISFGTAVVFKNSSSYSTGITYDSTNDRVVIGYTPSTFTELEAIVGTVSGTSISFGSSVVVASTFTPTTPNLVFDSANGKVIITSTDQTTNDLFAFVGTVSGTSISFGTPVTVYNSVVATNAALVYDSVSGKVISAYKELSTNVGYAVVGTVSGTSISFGTRVLIYNSNLNYLDGAYNVVAGKVIITFRGASGFLYFNAGVVSGTNITFDPTVTAVSSDTSFTSPVYDSTAGKIAISFVDATNSTFGTSIVVQNLSTNLTTENYIGISGAAYTNGQTATIQIVGSVDDAQSSLTAGKQYYVQADGTLNTTAGSPSVFAGTAVSATKLIVKG